MDILNVEPAKPVARNISNSEVTTFLSCKRQYEYAFMMELAPKKTSEPLGRGSVFHDAMHLYWRARLEGMSHKDAMTAAENAFLHPCVPTDVTVVMKAQYLWTRYMEYHNGFPNVEPLGTEVKHELPLTSTITMAIQYDFYYKDLTNGELVLLDYKVSYDFWSLEDHDLNAQMPKYIAVLQANGFKVSRGQLEEIRSRPLGAEKQRDPKNLWRSTNYRPSSPRKQAVLRQHIAASLEIEKHRALPVEERKAASLPVLNKHGACKFCNFKDLCTAELEGKKDLSVDIRVNYTQNEYALGYNEAGDSSVLNF